MTWFQMNFLGLILIRYGTTSEICTRAPTSNELEHSSWALKLKYNRDEIYIRSTDFDRTIQSAEANMQGIGRSIFILSE